MLEALVRGGQSPDAAAQSLRGVIEDDALVARVLEFRQHVAEQQRLLTTRTSLWNPEEATQAWYTGPRPDDVFWPGLSRMLTDDPGWRDAVPSLDASSTSIVRLLDDPHSPTIRTRGLVLGHVQSGKTANFTATIAKSADAGYRLFIVLSGVHNALRRQTQERLDEQLVAVNRDRWVPLTDALSDFGNPVRALPLMRSPDLRLLAVVKKNVSRMRRLRDWLYDAHEQNGLATCPVLIIDDEADQASVNSSRNPELNRTAINQLLVELLQLPRVAYVGYTATPFANVLVNPADASDVYPRSFIHALDKPAGYFGSRELFGRRVSEDEEQPEDAGHDMIRVIDDAEAALHSHSSIRDNGVAMSPSLVTAIHWFVLATAARRVRSGEAKHSSMLVHASMRVDAQNDYVPLIQQVLTGLAVAVGAGKTDPLRRLWDDEAEREPSARHGLSRVEFDGLLPTVRSLLDLEAPTGITVVADNSNSVTDRLIYGDDAKAVIAVGGNTLSRGLTLEGLVSSFFTRAGSSYDSLLQMGRWFGYRRGYSDLPRIWTSKDLRDDFEFLSDIEDDMRTEIRRYAERDNVTPLHLPVRIALHPRMHVTSPLKMHFTVRGQASYSQQRPQTTYFSHRDTRTIQKNTDAVAALVTDVLKQGSAFTGTDAARVAYNVDAAVVLDFVDRYSFHERSEMSSRLLRDYITGQNAHGALESWNVAFIGLKEPGEARSEEVVIDGVGVPLIQRSRLRNGGTPQVANIGTLMSRPDRVIDLMSAADVRGRSTDDLDDARNRDGRGLLLVYPIRADSRPRANLVDRDPLDAVGHVFGVAFAFPAADPATEPTDTIQVDLSRVSAEYLEEQDDLYETYSDDEGDLEVVYT